MKRRGSKAPDAGPIKHAFRFLQLRVTDKPTGSLQTTPGNPKTRTPKQLRKLTDAIERFGFLVPILIDENSVVIAGEHWLAAAKMLGLEQVPTICVTHLSKAEKRAYRIAESRLAELGGWDRALLAVEFEAIVALDPEFDITITGFEAEEIDLIFDLAAGTEPPEDDPPPAPAGPAVSHLGDLWRCGEHLLFCGDALLWESYAALMGRARAAMVISDVPFNVPINGHVSGKGKVRRREFVQASGELSEAAFIRFLERGMVNMARASKPGSLHYLFIDWRHMFEMLTAGRAVFPELKNLIIWNKGVGGMGSLYRSQHELIALFKKAGGQHVNNVMLGKNGRDRTNVWDFPGMSSFSAERSETLALHPTVKPVAMIVDAILDASRRGDLVLDPFSGSGTTMLAAEQTGRRARLMELDPLYVDVALRRFQARTGVEPVLVSTGESFRAVADSRAAEAENG